MSGCNSCRCCCCFHLLFYQLRGMCNCRDSIQLLRLAAGMRCVQNHTQMVEMSRYEIVTNPFTCTLYYKPETQVGGHHYIAYRDYLPKNSVDSTPWHLPKNGVDSAALFTATLCAPGNLTPLSWPRDRHQ
jgi:hypothetical protein